MKFTEGTAVTYGGEAWSVIAINAESGQYQVQSLDGKRQGWVSETEVQRAP